MKRLPIQAGNKTGFFAKSILLCLSIFGLGLSIYVGQQEIALPSTIRNDELRLLDVSRLEGLRGQSATSWAPGADEAIMQYTNCVNSLTAGNCAAIIRSVLDQKPADGQLWLEYAKILAREGDADLSAFYALEQSYRVAPRSRWVAVPRALFSLAVWGALPENLKILEKREVRSYYNDSDFLRTLADKYVSNLFLRAPIEDLMSDATPQEKLQFLHMVEEASKQRQ